MINAYLARGPVFGTRTWAVMSRPLRAHVEPTLVTSAGCRYAQLVYLLRIRLHTHTNNQVPNTLVRWRSWDLSRRICLKKLRANVCRHSISCVRKRVTRAWSLETSHS